MLFEIREDRRSLFIIISSVVLLLDIVFVAINYYTSKTALDSSLKSSALVSQKSFNLTLSVVYDSMLQMATQISHLDDLNQLFLKGKKAVEEEGGGAGDVLANEARLELLNKVKPGWDVLTNNFSVRQLHYHLGPGSVSFLRVHKPEKFGDRMDNVRYTIVDTNAEKTSRYGFETGRVYSGLRGVVPIWTQDPDSHENIHVGALEVGTSFSLLLKSISTSLGIEMAVFLKENHVKENMWPDHVERRFNRTEYHCDSFLESFSGDKNHLIQIIKLIGEKKESCKLSNIELINLDEKSLSTYTFPLRDYRGSENFNLPPAGYIFMWSDTTAQIEEFNLSIWINILYAIIGFIVIELALLISLRFEEKLHTAKEHALIDALTSIPNRRDFDAVLEREIKNAQRNQTSLCLLLFDIDHFKNYNDEFGHLVGDDCLKRVAVVAKSVLKRPLDYIARFGGEEFAVLLPETSHVNGLDIAEQLRSAIENTELIHQGGNIISNITVSVGVVSFCGTDMDSTKLFQEADKYVYLAKDKGRNRVEGFSFCE